MEEGGGGVNGGHRVMRGLNATNAMSQGLIKTSSVLHPRSGHAHMHLCNDGGGGWVGEGGGGICEYSNVQYTQSSLLVHTVWDKWPCKK